jgi:hypothetical protein
MRDPPVGSSRADVIPLAVDAADRSKICQEAPDSAVLG